LYKAMPMSRKYACRGRRPLQKIKTNPFRVASNNSMLAGKSKTHLCTASIIRAMPETEIPPVIRGDIYYSANTSRNLYFQEQICFTKVYLCGKIVL